MTDVFATPPFHVNEIGTKWWLDESVTKYASREDQSGRKLNVTVWYVETKDGYCSRVITSNETRRILYESKSLEAIACYADVLRMVESSRLV